MGLDETGSLPVSLIASDGTMVSAMASLATETSDDGAVTARYLAFDLPAGTSAQMDLMLSCAAADRIALVPVLVGADDMPQAQSAVSLQWIETPGIATDDIFTVTESGGETPTLLGSADSGAFVGTGEEGELYVYLRHSVQEYLTFTGADPDAQFIKADPGDTVTVIPKDPDQYVVTNLYICDDASGEILQTITDPADLADGYSFVMPEKDVVITGNAILASQNGIMLMSVGDSGDVLTLQSHATQDYGAAGWGSGWDTSEYTFRFSDGSTHIGFCAEPGRKTPMDGATWVASTTSGDGLWHMNPTPDPNLMRMAKVLYYGWGGPMDCTWMYASTNAQRIILTHAAVARAMYEDWGNAPSGDWAHGLNASAVDIVNNFYDACMKQSVPDGVILFFADSGKAQTGSNKIGQMLVGLYYSPPPTGTAKLQKIASNMDLFNGNNTFWTNCYSYEGAVYGVYNSDWEAYMNINAVGTLTTDWLGNSNELTLSPGTYYVKEISASPGFDLDPNTYPVTVTSGQTATVTSYEPPKNDPVGIRITKIQNGEATSTIPSLEGTRFTVRFYAGYYDRNTLPATPTRTWVIEVKEVNGSYITGLTESYLVKELSDPLFKDNSGNNVALPLGTVTIQETTPAPGYTLDGYLKDPNGNVIATNSELYISQVIANDSGVHLAGGNTFTAEDTPRPTNLQIRKLDPNGNPRSGVTYELKNSKGQVVTTATTDGSGIARFNNLYPDVYTITETNAPDGLQLLKDPITVQVPLRVTEQQIVENGIDRSKCVYDPYENIYYIFDLTYEVNNDVILEMPVTGMTDSLWTWMPLLAGGVLFVGTALAVIRKKRRNA